MIVQEGFLNKIKDFGLNSYEAKIWAALLSRGVATAGELSDIANVPRSRSYDVLESLEKKGFIIMKLGKPIKYIAVSPSDVVDRVKKKIDNDTQAQMGMLEELESSKVFDELKLLHSQGVEAIDPGEMTGSFKGRDSVYNHLKSSIKNAQHSVVLVTTKDGLNRKAELLSNEIKKANKRGVSIKIAAPVDNDNKDTAKRLAKHADMRHIDHNGRMLLVDGKDASFMLHHDEEVHPTYDSAVWINSSYFTQFLNKFIDCTWNSLEPINDDN